MKKTRSAGACDAGRLVDLLAGRLKEGEAADARRHLAECPSCREWLEEAEILHKTTVEGLASGLDMETMDLVWSRVGPKAARSAEAVRRNNALRGFMASWQGKLLASSVAAAVIIAAVVLAGLWMARADRRVVAGQKLVAGLAGSTRAEYECGAIVVLSPGTRAIVESSSGISGALNLDSGSVDVRVKRLDDGGTFVVRTADAVVNVKGTMFRVSKTEDESTSVSVMQGSVSVVPKGKARAGMLLEAGQSARVPSLDAFLEDVRSEAERAILTGNFDKAAELVDTYSAETGSDDATGLEMELAGALVGAGDQVGGMEIYVHVAETTSSVHAQNALAILAILLERSGRKDEAVEAWKDYLSRFPDGIHAEEARTGIGQEPGDPVLQENGNRE
jgi:hypothetical protein